MRFAKSAALAGVVAMAAGCAASVGDEPQDAPEPVGTHAQALTCSAASSSSCVLTTYEGYDIFRDTCSDNGSFYTTDTQADVCCSPGSSGCKYTGLRWQCVEWARRYTWKKWGPVWKGVTGASDMCAAHPSGTKIVSKPVPGDVVVYGPGACLRKSSSGSCIAKAHATYGHVGVVIGNPTSSKDRVKDQNGPQNAYNDYLKSAVKCYVHANANPRTCFSGQKRTVSDATCASGKAKQTCTSAHVWGSKTCVPVEANCGNDVIEGSEVCSGSNLDGKTCTSEGFGGGTLACKCVDGVASLDTSQCYDCDSSGGADPCSDDDDNDGTPDTDDNCPLVANEGQTDSDGDGAGDACDSDSDGDGVANGDDNCPDAPNSEQADYDKDGTGDDCDADQDNDGVLDDDDDCPLIADANQTDLDDDGIGDACDDSPGSGGTSGANGWGGGGANAAGSSGSAAGSGSQQTHVLGGDDGGCSVRAPRSQSSSALLCAMWVALGAAACRARSKRMRASS
jgi:hypothetical protein